MCLIISPRITFSINILTTKSIILLFIYNINLKYSIESIYFSIILDFLNKILENNKGKSLNHFYIHLYIS